MRWKKIAGFMSTRPLLRVSEVEDDCWVYVYKAIVEFVELPQTHLTFLLLKT